MNSKHFFLASFFALGFLPILALAADPLVYKPLVGIPGIGNSSNFGDYINALYGLSIAIAALMAVIKIIIAGVKYMLSDVVTSKTEAIGDIRGSLLGLGIVISAVLVLKIINPQLTQTEIFMEPIVLPDPSGSAVAAPVGVAVSGPGYDAVPYVQDQEPSFRSGCVAAGGIYEYVLGSNALMVCFKALTAETITEINTKYLLKDRDMMKKIYQKTIVPRKVSPTSIEPKITTYTQYDNVSVGTIYLATEHPQPPTWLDKGAREKMNIACQAIRSNINDSVERGNTRLISDGSFFACVTLTPF